MTHMSPNDFLSGPIKLYDLCQQEEQSGIEIDETTCPCGAILPHECECDETTYARFFGEFIAPDNGASE